MPTLPDFAERTPDKPALIMAGSGEAVTYAELEARSNRFAHLLRALGIRAGDHIAFFVENHPRFFELCWGAKRAGLYYTAISSYLTAGEVAYIVNDCGARLFVSTDYKRDVAADVPPLCPAAGALPADRRRGGRLRLLRRRRGGPAGGPDRRRGRGHGHALFVRHHRAGRRR